MIVEITYENYEEIILKSERPVVLGFYSNFDGSSTHLPPYLKDLAQEYAKEILIALVNIDNDIEIALDNNVKIVPSVLFFKDGKVVERKVGIFTRGSYKDIINSLILNLKDEGLKGKERNR